ncbi:MAG: PTS sugar transporter subunit IIC [Clostridiales bacterium]|nr:PTS sugar transporter subunit IIC [Clostridiales bacterium]
MSEETVIVEEQKPEKPSFGERAKGYLKSLPKRYFITAFSGMAQGLFVTLIAGTILATLAKDVIGLGNFFSDTLYYVASIAKSLMGAGIGIGIAHSLGKNKLLVFSSAVAGMIGAFADKLLFGSFANGLFPNVTAPFTAITFGAPGNPIGAYVVTMLCVELVELYAGKTKLDIILVPLGVMLLSFVGIFVASPFIYLVDKLGVLIAMATGIAPFFMGIIVAVVMGVLLTLPTSSAAIWIAVAKSVIEAGGANADYMMIAGGAATVGCACHMVGFAVASFRENRVSGLISQGLGTSMLQIPNVMRKPVIMLPMIISSAILGPLSTCVFMLKCSYNGGGMGTSGLVGVIDLFTNTTGVLGIIGIILLMFVLPAVLNFLISEFMRKKNWIKDGDMKLPD